MPQGKYGSPTVGGNTNERLDKYRLPTVGGNTNERLENVW